MRQRLIGGSFSGMVPRYREPRTEYLGARAAILCAKALQSRPRRRFRRRLSVRPERTFPQLFRLGQLLFVIAFQVFRLRHMPLMDAAVVVTKRLAQRISGRPRQGRPGHRAP